MNERKRDVNREYLTSLAGEVSGPAPGGEPAQSPRAGGFLPHPLTQYVDREDAMKCIGTLLKEPGSLVTLTGMGGVGKTRLATAVAERARNDRGYPGGVYFVSFEDYREVDADAGQGVSDLWKHLATELQLDASQPEDVVRCWCTNSSGTLLVMDNCETVSKRRCARLIRKTTEYGKVQVLATSRVKFNIAGQKAYEVPPMSEDEAVQLFRSRAGEAADRSDPQAVKELCRRLDYIPLAIVLAAARAGRGVEKLTAELTHILDLMGPDDQPDRQVTLRATLDWSYEQLCPEDQGFLPRLLVFHGSWTEDAMLRICLGQCEEQTWGQERLKALCSTYFVSQGSIDGERRYRFLDIVRQYVDASAKKGKLWPRPNLRNRFRDHFLDLAIETITASPDMKPLETERENILAAIESFSKGKNEQVTDKGRVLLKKTDGALAKHSPWSSRRSSADPASSGKDQPQFDRLYPLAVACRELARQCADPQATPDPLSPYPELKLLDRAVAIWSIFERGTDWDSLFFGSARPGFERLHDIEIKLKDEVHCTISVLTQLRRAGGGVRKARLAFTCMYLLAHYWWESFLKEGSISAPMLDIWEAVQDEQQDRQGQQDRVTQLAEDKRLLTALRSFSSNYPQLSLGSAERQRAGRWKEVRQSLEEIQRAFGLDGNHDADHLEHLERYVRAITSMYLAEAIRHIPGGHPAGDWESLYLEAQKLLDKHHNNDEFHYRWARYELAEAYEQTGDLQNAENAENECNEALKLAADGIAGIELDIEIISSLYFVKADVRWRQAEHAKGSPDRASIYHESFVHYAASLFLAYIFVLRDADAYAVKCYEIATDRVLERLKSLRSRAQKRRGFFSGPDLPRRQLFVEACVYLRAFWEPFFRGREALNPDRLLDEKDDELHQELLPPAPAGADLWARVTQVAKEPGVKNAQMLPSYLKDVYRVLDEMPKHLEAIPCQWPDDERRLPDDFKFVVLKLHAAKDELVCRAR